MTINEGARQNVARNMYSVKGLQKPLRKRGLGDKGGIPVAWSRHCQEVIKSGMLLYIFHLVKPVKVSHFTP